MAPIRLMRKEDADAVRQVDSIAFGAWVRQVSGESDPTYKRTRPNVLACWERDPEGCFVVKEESQVVGFIFSRTWGGVGWFGTFAVLPEYQGQGIGQRLIAASLGYLRQKPGRLIGLETMPESAYNLGLYLKLGFRVTFPSLSLVKALDRAAVGGAGLPRWSAAGTALRERWLNDLREAAGQILPGLDYAKEVLWTAEHGGGETLVLLDGERAIGLSVVRLASDWEGLGQERASVQVLALQPEHTNEGTFAALLDASESLASADGKNTLAVAVNTRHAWAVEQLLGRGYRVARVMVRMVLKGTGEEAPGAGCVDLSRWAG
jgi:ribosomal protein S18 acetylase RimI-like enzyme